MQRGVVGVGTRENIGSIKKENQPKLNLYKTRYNDNSVNGTILMGHAILKLQEPMDNPHTH